MDAQKLIDNFSSHLKNIIAKSIAMVSSLQIGKVEPIHLLYCMMQEPGSIGLEILRKMNVIPERIKEHAPDFFIEQTEQDLPALARLPELSPASRKVLEKALVLAHEHGHTYIGTEHLLFGLIDAGGQTIQDFFTQLHIDPVQLENQLAFSLQNTSRFSQLEDAADMLEELQQLPPQDILPQLPPQQPHTHAPTQKKQAPSALMMFTNELTSTQAQEKIDPVIGREDEIERIIHILSRRTKNNPILVGEPGVGKTAIVEGLAKRIAEGDVPAVLRRKKIFSLDLTLLVAGTIYRGEFEARLKQIIDECAQKPQYILFVDEIHNIIGAGSNQGTMDAANILKPALARGLLRCIGATTYDEFKRYISSDPALERRFQKIDVEEPNEMDTLRILEGVKKYYEQFHTVTITATALKEAVSLSNRYIHDNFQPDKSIDLIDEAASAVRSRQKESQTDTAQFALEKKLEEVTTQKDTAIAEERLKDAIKLKKQVETLEKKIEKMRTEKKKEVQVLPKVTEKDVHTVLSSKMHINKQILSQNEWDNISTLTERLQKHIIGQDEILDEVVRSLKRAQLAVKKDKPFASFLFLGPSGVGKTELAKRLAEELYHDTKALIKLDMGEFSEGHSVSKLLGSPAGYIGYKDRNLFLEKIKQRPYCVLLFDEIDKAHPDVTKLLLQILDEGVLHDNNGKLINLKHTIIIMTGNIGADFFKRQSIGFGGATSAHEKELRARIVAQAKEELGASLLSRINTVSLFRPLSAAHIERIIQKQLNSLIAHITQTQQINIAVDNTVLSALRENLDISDSGARHIEQQINDIIPELLIDIVSKKTKKKKYTLEFDSQYRLK